MATTTTNYGLTKPATTDNYDIGVFNGNADIADAQMKADHDLAAAAVQSATLGGTAVPKSGTVLQIPYPTAAQVGAIPTNGNAGSVNGVVFHPSTARPGGISTGYVYGFQSGEDTNSYVRADSNINSGTVGGYSFEDSNADPSGSLPAGRVHFTWS